jgi:hypothetical protein
MRAGSGHTIVTESSEVPIADSQIKFNKRKPAFIALSPASTSPMSALAPSQVHSQVAAHGEKQTPV